MAMSNTTSTAPAPFSLGTLEQAVVGGTAVVSAAALTDQFGPLPAWVKLVAYLVLAVDGLLGYKHISS